jgi:transposase-like protein
MQIQIQQAGKSMNNFQMLDELKVFFSQQHDYAGNAKKDFKRNQLLQRYFVHIVAKLVTKVTTVGHSRKMQTNVQQIFVPPTQLPREKRLKRLKSQVSEMMKSVMASMKKNMAQMTIKKSAKFNTKKMTTIVVIR